VWVITQHSPNRFLWAFTTGIPFSWRRETLIASISAPSSSNHRERPTDSNSCCPCVNTIAWRCRLCPLRNNTNHFGCIHERANSFNIDPPNTCGTPFRSAPRSCATKQKNVSGLMDGRHSHLRIGNRSHSTHRAKQQSDHYTAPRHSPTHVTFFTPPPGFCPLAIGALRCLPRLCA
jgi:hypothetical protein